MASVPQSPPLPPPPLPALIQPPLTAAEWKDLCRAPVFVENPGLAAYNALETFMEAFSAGNTASEC